MSAGSALLPHMDAVVTAGHQANSSGLHREGFCVVCSETYEALHRMCFALDGVVLAAPLEPGDES